MKTIQKDSILLREEYLEEQAWYYAEKNDCNLEHIIQCMKHREKSKKIYQIIRNQINPPYNPLTSIIIPSENGQWTRVIAPTQINHHIINSNKDVMTSAQNFFPASDLYQELFGKYGDNPSAQKLIDEGILPTDEWLSDQIRNILQYIKKPDNCNKDDIIESELTDEEF